MGLNPRSFWPRDERSSPLSHSTAPMDLSPWQEVLSGQHLEPAQWEVTNPHDGRLATSMGIAATTALATVDTGSKLLASVQLSIILSLLDVTFTIGQLKP